MRTRWLILVIVGSLAVAAVSCGDDGATDVLGGDADDAGDDVADAGAGADDEGSGDEGSDDEGSGGGGGTAAVIDPGAMPPPAEATVEVDGEVLTFRPQDASDDRLFICDVGAEMIAVNMQTPEGHDLLVQVQVLEGLEGGEWAGSVVARDTESDRTYQGSPPWGGEAFAVDDDHMVFVGPFEYFTPDDRGNFIDAGEARISVTCP